MGKILSIIIPTYNMEKYLCRCLDSLLIPEIGSLEILVVNDGSKDSSSEIAHRYADQFPESIKVIDKPNGNYGSCINAALKIATGKYIKVLDSDDFFDKNNFSIFIKELDKIDADVILTNYDRVDEETLLQSVGKDLSKTGIALNTIIDLDTVRKFIFYPLMHLVTYRTEILHHINYSQTEGISYTDTEWCFLPFATAQKFVALPITVYKYVIGRQGQTVSPEAMARSNPSFFKIINKLSDTLVENSAKLSASQHRYLTEYLNNVYLTLALRIFDSHDPKQAIEFKGFEYGIMLRHPDIYNSWNSLSYNRHSTFKIIKEWREKDYNPNLSIPSHNKLQLKIINFLSLLRKKIGIKPLYSKQK